MQPIIDTLGAVVEMNLAIILGCLLVAIFALQGLLLVYGSLRRVHFDRLQRQLSLEHLRWQIDTAALRHRHAEHSDLLWNGYRKFHVARKEHECRGVYSFYLRPHDGRTLPAFKPGQYLTFQLNVPKRDKPVVRCYSLSDSPAQNDYYRVTIKREGPPREKPEAPPGLASSYFCDQLQEGEILDVKAPSGQFFLDIAKRRPVVLLAGGVGVTPLLCMAKAIIDSGSDQEIWFFYGVRNGREHIFKEEIDALSGPHDNLRLYVCYSRPDPDDTAGMDYRREGRVNIELLKELLPSCNYEFYLCGSGPFMKDLTEGLEAWGVPEDDIHFEAFGPATIKKKVAAPELPAPGTPTMSVTFAKTGQRCLWNPASMNLWEMAQAQGVDIDYGCGAGSCGSCKVAIKSGHVDYVQEPDFECEAGSCLTCICKPRSDLVLDA